MSARGKVISFPISSISDLGYVMNAEPSLTRFS